MKFFGKKKKSNRKIDNAPSAYRRSVWLDNDPRTKKVTKLIKWLVLLAVLFVFSGYKLVTGVLTYNYVTATSSTNYGSQLTFTRSQATWTLGHIYTDKDKDMLVVQLQSNVQANQNLPANGSDYGVYIYDKNGGNQTIPVAFGRYGTDGDMYLFLPNPKPNYVYQLFIMNRQFLQQTIQGDNSTSQSSIADINNGRTSSSDERKSITAILSQNVNQATDNGVPKYKVASNDTDLISFRVTLNSNAKYVQANKTIILNKPLVTNGTLNFANFFNETLQGTSISTLQKQLTNYNAQLPELKKTENEYQARLKANPNDQASQTSLQNVQTQIQTLQQNIQNAQANIEQYKKATFKSDQFVNIQTKGTVYSK